MTKIDRQVAALTAAGCRRIFTDKKSVASVRAQVHKRSAPATPWRTRCPPFTTTIGS
ncbi:hypothetical protein [Nocardia sp. NPDC052112]|uniref:hypothetical protein n=1 Tax=Nocardia sp. NPDC052112 TaxID=3155646 RepID=UPI003441BA52